MGARDPTRFVCTECFEDTDLQAVVEAAAQPDADECSFCHASGEGLIACELDEILDHIKQCILESYDLAANCLGWNGREGGWQGEYWDTYDLIRDEIAIGLPNDTNDALFYEICGHIGHEDWCEQNPYDESPVDRLRFDWAEFTQIVKHHTRFFISDYQVPQHPYLRNERADPVSFLRAIGSAAIRLGLIGEVEPSTEVFRARFQRDSEPLNSASALGPPPPDKALISNRMSPPGIVMFYGALEVSTALEETVKDSGTYWVGTFRTLRSLRVLDLTQLPEVPGMFAVLPDSQEWKPHEARFFREFVDDLTQPIERDDRIHLEYVPTQVLIEYFRRRFAGEFEVAPIDGVVYPSARSGKGTALVLFCERESVLPSDGLDGLGIEERIEPWLALVSQHSVDVPESSLLRQPIPEQIDDFAE